MNRDKADDGSWRQQLAVDRRVEHRHLGEGVVRSLSTSGDKATVTVEFGPPFGIKVLKLAHTTLRVLDSPAGPRDG